MMETTDTSRVGRLRALTAERHAELERLSGLPASIRTRADLLRVLETFHGFLVPLEPRLRDALDWPGLGLAHVADGRCARLARDLAALGLGADERAAVPTPPESPACDGPAAAWGIAYVLEGSTMGGQLMARHLEQHDAPDIPTRSHYFDAYGARTSANWRDFRTALDALRLDAEDERALVNAARETFAHLADWFDRRLRPRA